MLWLPFWELLFRLVCNLPAAVGVEAKGLDLWLSPETCARLGVTFPLGHLRDWGEREGLKGKREMPRTDCYGGGGRNPGLLASSRTTLEKFILHLGSNWSLTLSENRFLGNVLSFLIPLPFHLQISSKSPPSVHPKSLPQALLLGNRS